MGGFAGIDVDAAAGLAAAWRAVAARVDEAVRRSCVLSDDLAVDTGAVRADGEQVAGELRASAELLGARAAAMAGIGWIGAAWAPAAMGRRRPGDDELVDWLGAGQRGTLVTDLAEPDAATWAELVAAGSTTEGGRTRRFVDVAARSGAGVIVVDVFIPERNSLVVAGDGRGHDDPIFGDLTDDDSRMIIVADLGTGRASIQLDDTCLAGGRICNEARPIETGGAEVVWAPSTDWGDHVIPGVPRAVELLEIPNQVTLSSRPGRLEIDYDILNGVIPAPSVDGTITITTDRRGGAHVEELDSDGYPSIGVYHYGIGRTVQVLARQDSRGVAHAVPWLPTVADAVGTAAERGVDVLVGGLDVEDLLEQRRRDAGD